MEDTMPSAQTAPAPIALAALSPAGIADYPAWAAAHALTDADRRLIAQHIGAMVASPLISVLTPVFNTPVRWLRACLDSVLAQLYPHWELCIADDASTQPGVRAVLAEYAARDPRIKVVYRPAHGHICDAANSALALAAGSVVVLLDHDDTLAAHALYSVAATLAEHPDAGLIYSDEDYVDHLDRPLQPWFKPAWNRDLLHAYDYIGHLVAAPAAWLRRTGGMRPGLEGSQDYDLLLRLAAELPDARIHHIPHVLYHWRAHFLSVAGNLQSKPYVPVATRRALTDAIAARGVGAEVLDVAGSSILHRVRYPLPEPTPLVSVLIDATGHPERLAEQIAALRQTHYPALEVIVAAMDSLAELPAAQQPSWTLRTIRWDRPGGAAAVFNGGAAVARGELLCCLGEGAVPTDAGWLEELASHALRPEVGAVGPHVRRLDGHAGAGEMTMRRDGLEGPPWLPPGPRRHALRNVAALTSACLVLRRAEFQAAGGFDAELTPAAAVLDLCLRLRQRGYWLVLTPFAEVEDAGGENEEDHIEAVEDPFANPNLVWQAGKAAFAMPSPAPRPWEHWAPTSP
jgi:GT2 family glycosyltransferase